MSRPIPGGWSPLDAGPSDAVSTMLLHERLAAQITVYDPVVAATLVQAQRYARALLAGGGHLSHTAIDAQVAARRARQRALSRIQVRAFIPETALHTSHGDLAARHAQHRHLLLEQHRLHVVPGTAPALPAFELMTFPEFAALVVVETPTALLFSEHPSDIGVYRDIVSRLHSVALPDDQSRALIRRLADEEPEDSYHHGQPADLVPTAFENASCE